MNLSKEEKIAFNNLIALGCTVEEAEQTIIDDRAINKGEKLFELTAEQEENSKKARRAERKKNTTYSKRERKKDYEKSELITLIANAIGENVIITNPERQIDFVYKDRKFRVILSAPRS